MADDADDGEEDERAIELSVVEAIYPELSIDPSNPYSAEIDVPVEPQKPLPLRFPSPNDGALTTDLPGALTALELRKDGGENSATMDEQPENGIQKAGNLSQEIYHLSNLPPLKLRLTLPEGYPSDVPPRFRMQSSWLPAETMKSLEEAGTRLWEDIGRAQVVFAYVDYLRDAADKAFDMLSGNRTTLNASVDLKASLLDFDLTTKRTKFEHETFECGICVEPKKGSMCHRLSLCFHVFCIECLQDFYNSCIIEGDVGNVKCVTPNCGDEPLPSLDKVGSLVGKSKRKKDRTIGPSELLQIPLEQETVQRYIKLKRKKRLESDRTTIYCPRQWCQGPARSKKASGHSDDLDSDPDDEPEGPPEPEAYDPNEPNKLPPPSERLAICEDCTFAFCKVCKASWHGEYYTCFPRSQFELTAEERASEDYMKLHTQPCPTCNARAQKTQGCNHMICFKCDTHFCYLCGAYLERDNPYQHYNSRNKECYMRLWELEAGDGGDIGQGFDGGVGDMEALVDELVDEGLMEGGLEAFAIDPPQPPMLPAARVPPPAPVPPPVANPPVARPQARVAQPAVQGRGGGRGGGGRQDAALQRFLEMVQNDEEDEWDSDDMEDDAEGLGDRWIGIAT